MYEVIKGRKSPILNPLDLRCRLEIWGWRKGSCTVVPVFVCTVTVVPISAPFIPKSKRFLGRVLMLQSGYFRETLNPKPLNHPQPLNPKICMPRSNVWLSIWSLEVPQKPCKSRSTRLNPANHPRAYTLQGYMGQIEGDLARAGKIRRGFGFRIFGVYLTPKGM